MMTMMPVRPIDANKVKAAINHIREKYKPTLEKPWAQFTSDAIRYIEKAVNGSPTVDLVRRHGHWVQSHEYNDDIGWKCSVCRATFIVESGDPIGDEFFYCPKCGAKMDG